MNVMWLGFRQHPTLCQIGRRWPGGLGAIKVDALNAYDVQVRNYCIRAAGPDDLDGARAVMLDTVYRDFGSGYVPRWHADIIDPAAAYLASPRHTLLVALDPEARH